MQTLNKVLQLSPAERWLLFETLVLLNLIRLGLVFVPFQQLRRLLARGVARSDQLMHRVSPEHIAWAVNAVCSRIPNKAKCLAQALATQGLLSRYGYTSELRIGVAKDCFGKLAAHAWVEYQGRVVIGGLPNLETFTPLPALELDP